MDQRLCDASGTHPSLCVGDVLPVTGFAILQFFALGHEGALRHGVRPMLQAVGDTGGVVLQCLVGAQVLRAVSAIPQGHAGYAKRQGTKFGSVHAHVSAGLDLNVVSLF